MHCEYNLLFKLWNKCHCVNFKPEIFLYQYQNNNPYNQV